MQRMLAEYRRDPFGIYSQVRFQAKTQQYANYYTYME